MDLKKELRIMVKYILPPEDRDNDVIENYVDTLALINEEYTKQLLIQRVSQQRELLSCKCKTASEILRCDKDCDIKVEYPS